MKWLDRADIAVVLGAQGLRDLKSSLRFEDKRGIIWEVPVGSRSNLSDFPWFVRMFTKTTALVSSPFLHDHLYENQPIDPRTNKRVTRKKADQLYRDGAICEGMSKDEAELLYGGLRIGGWVAWRKYEKRLKKKRRAMKRG